MGFFSNLLGHSDNEYEYEDDADETETADLPRLHNGTTLSVETAEGKELFSGQIAGYTQGDTELTLERVPGGLSFKILELGSTLLLRGNDELMQPYVLKGTVQESSRLVFRVKDVKLKPIEESRENFRLMMRSPAELFYMTDENRTNPEECTLVDISIGGACLESEYLHAEDEVLRLKIKLEDYIPMEYVGEIIRVEEYAPRKFRYGFLFAQLNETERTELTRTLYNLQVGNKLPFWRHGAGHW